MNRPLSIFFVCAALVASSSSTRAQPTPSQPGLTKVFHGQSLTGNGTTTVELDARVAPGGGLDAGIAASGITLLRTCAISQLLVWNGSSWGCSDPAGDITAVVAGNGLTGGGTSGAVTLDVGSGNGITVGADAISVNNGTGLIFSTGALTYDSAVIQTRVGSTCTAPNSITAISSTGTVTCTTITATTTDVNTAVNGTANKVGVFASTHVIGNGWASDDGTSWGVSGKFLITEATGNTAINGSITGDGGNRVIDTTASSARIVQTANSIDLAIVGGGAGSCTNCSVTFDVYGRETAHSSGTAPATGTGTANTTTKWTGTSTIGNAWPTDDGTTWGVTSKFTITEASGNFRTFGTATVDGAFVGSSTGSFSGALNMNSNKITSLTNGSSAQDAVAFNQLATAINAAVTGTTNRTTKFTGTNAVGNGWASDDGTTWGTSSIFTITEASGNFRSFGTGTIDGAALLSSTLHTVGAVTFDGNTTLGDTSADTITFTAVAATTLDMNTHKVLNLTNGSSAQDAVAFNQLATAVNAAISGTSGTIPKFTGTNTIGNSSVLDNATTVSTTEAVSIGTASGLGKLSVLSGNPGTIAGTVLTNTAWDTNYTLFGPNVASATGALLALAYSTTDDTAKILSLKPGNAWKGIDLFSSAVRFYENGSVILTLDTSTLAMTGAGTFSTTLGVTGLTTLTGGFTLGADSSANSHKITSLTNGSSAQDAAAFGQLATAVNAAVTGTANTIAMFTGTNAIGNSLLTVASSTLTVGEAMIVSGVTGVDSETVNFALTAQTASRKSVAVNNTGTFNTTSGALSAYGDYASVTATRSSGANNLTNVGGHFDASGGQVNVALETTGSGLVNLAGAATLSSTLHTVGAATFDGNLTFGDTSGDTMTFTAVAATTLDMASHKVLNLTNGSSAQDAAAFGQLATAVNAAVSGTTNTTTKFTGTNTIGNAWALDDATTWGVSSKFTITEASGNFRTFGTGTVDGALLASSTSHLVGAVTIDGNTTLGDATTDTTTINGATTGNITSSGGRAFSGNTTLTGATADSYVFVGTVSGTFDATAAGRAAYASYASAIATRSAGANSLQNFAYFANASGGQSNWDFYGNAGVFYQNDSSTLHGAVTMDSTASVGGTLDMTSHKILNVTNGAGAQDAAAFGQLATAVNTAISGTLNTIPKFTGTNTIGNSSLTDNGTSITSTEPVNAGKITVTVGAAAQPEFDFIQSGQTQWILYQPASSSTFRLYNGADVDVWTGTALNHKGALSVDGNTTLGDATSDATTINGTLAGTSAVTSGAGVTWTNTTSAATANVYGLNFTGAGTLNATSGVVDNIALNVAATATRSAGANLAINIALDAQATGAGSGVLNYGGYFSASGGSSGNIAIATVSGDVQLNTSSGTTKIGAGGDSASTTNTEAFVTNAGSTSFAVRDSTNDVEGYLAVSSSGVFFGSITNHLIALQTNGTTAIQIDTSQNSWIKGSANHVGSGGDSPTTANAVAWFTNAGATAIVVRDSSNDSEWQVTTSNLATTEGTVTNHALNIKTNNTNAITIDTSQNVGIVGHINDSGTVPSVAAGAGCGVSPTINANSNDNGGLVTVGTSISACVITFAHAYTNTPSCDITGNDTTVGAGTYYISAISNSSFTVKASGTLSGSKFMYMCIGLGS